MVKRAREDKDLVIEEDLENVPPIADKHEVGHNKPGSNLAQKSRKRDKRADRALHAHLKSASEIDEGDNVDVTDNNLDIAATSREISPPNPPITFQRSLSVVHSAPEKTTDLVFQAITIQQLSEKIKGNQATSTSPRFTLNQTTSNPKEGILIPPVGTGEPVKIKQLDDKVQCTFTEESGIREAAKILLEAFVSSGMTQLTIGGADKKMVLILADLVKEKMEQKGPNQAALVVHLADDARETLLQSGKKDLVQKFADTEFKPTSASRHSPI